MHRTIQYRFVLLFCAISFLRATASAEGYNPPVATNNPPAQEIIVQLKIQRLGSFGLIAYYHGSQVYLPLRELFSILKIKADISPNLATVSGFFLREDNPYLIDVVRGTIRFGSTTSLLPRDELFVAENEIYIATLPLDHFFGLHCVFDHSILEVDLTTEHPLPVFRERERLDARKRLQYNRGAVSEEREYPLQRSLLGGGTLDWNFSSVASPYGLASNYSVAVGGIVLGGDFDIEGSGNDRNGFSRKQTTWRWRYVADENDFFRQGTLGSVSTDVGSGSGGFTVRGIQISNRPPASRTLFGPLTISERVERDWDAELYINRQLADFTKPGDDGTCQFTIPMTYGSTLVGVKLYGPLGEERSFEQLVRMPNTMLPVGEFDYVATAGRLRNYDEQQIGQMTFRWGLSKNATLGGGVQYLEGRETSSTVPMLFSTARIGDILLLSGEYANTIVSKAAASLLLPSFVQIDLAHATFGKNDLASHGFRKEEQLFALRFPLQFDQLRLGSRFSFTRTVFRDFTSLSGEAGLSGSLAGMQTSIATRAAWSARATTRLQFLSSTMTVTAYPAAGIRLRPEIRYDHLQRRVSDLQLSAERNLLGAGRIRVSYERDMVWKRSGFSLKLRWDFPAARLTSATEAYDGTTTFSQQARGTLVFDQNNQSFVVSRAPWIRMGGLAVVPFLDLNDNGERDPDEPTITRIGAALNGGRALGTRRGEPVRFVELEPYKKYILQIDPQSLDNPLFVPKYTTYAVTVGPNEFRTIDIPILVAGEAVGIVAIEPGEAARRTGGLQINIDGGPGNLRTSTTTFSSGEFDVASLRPGVYTARVDTEQLGRLGLTAYPDSVSFEVRAMPQGDIIEGIKFILRSTQSEEADDDSEEPSGEATPSASSAAYAVQVGAFWIESHATELADEISRKFMLETNVVTSPSGNLFFVVAGRFTDVTLAESVRNSLQAIDSELFHDAFVTRLDQ